MKRLLLVVLCVFFVLGSACQSQSEPVIVLVTPKPSPSPTPIKTAPPEPTPTPEPEPAKASITIAGDLLCLSAQLSAARSGGEYNFDECFAVIKDKISAADLAIGNLETLVAEGHPYTQPNKDDADDPGTGDSTAAAEPAAPADPAAGTDPAAAPSPTKRPNPRINAPESFLSALSGCGFDVLTTANNHVYDYRADGLIKTLQKLDEYGFAHTGAYEQETDKAPLVMDVNGINVAVCAYTDIINNRPGDAFMVDRFDKDLVTADIAAAREAGADYVIVCVHWGVEHTHKPNRSQRKMAAFIAEAGADIILGSHPHCTQPFETVETDRGNVPVLYSLGNFISSMSQTMHKDGVLVNISLEKDLVTQETTLTSLTYTPTFCASSSDAGKYVIYPADSASTSQGDMASTLSKSRERTIEVLTESVATAE
jgi:poly-gamma-glutamate synthesis protein (capsule biosynthesis protein)